MDTLREYYTVLENDEIASLRDKSGIVQGWKKNIHEKNIR